MSVRKLAKPYFIEVFKNGAVGAGKVVPFPQKIDDPNDEENKTWIPLPRGARQFDKFTEFEVCGDSLEERGIFNGYILTCRTNFELWEIKPDKVCIVYINSRDEQIAKLVRFNHDDTVTLFSANRKYKPKTYFADEIEIIALVVEARFKT